MHVGRYPKQSGIIRDAAVVLVSGGLDSTVSLAMAIDDHGPKSVYPVRFFYDQTHSNELERAYTICKEYYSLPLISCGLDLPVESALVSQKEYQPSMVTRAVEEGLPPSFVPGRNAVMLSVAAGYAYSKGAQYIYGGWNVVDYSGYPDCRPTFLHQMEEALQHALSDYYMTIVAPVLLETKVDIIKEGLALKAPIHLTWSCYNGDEEPCGTCESCRIRVKAFKEADIDDPAITL